MKKLLKTFIAVAFFSCMISNPTIAQTSNNDMATTTNRDDDDNNNWGLLGLVGLLGLIGLKKNDRATNYTTTNTPSR